MRGNLLKIGFLVFLLLLFSACKDLDTINKNRPSRNSVLTKGTDLIAVLKGGYITWWQGVHGGHPTIALSVAGDAYGFPEERYGGRRMGNEPRDAYNNSTLEDNNYKEIAEAPWFGCNSALSSANDVLLALDNGISIDNGGPQDDGIRAAALFLRGLCWGYIGLIFDQGIIADENTDIGEKLPFSTYKELIEMAVSQLQDATLLAISLDTDFIHDYFNGVTLDTDDFIRLCNSYSARFLAQGARTPLENDNVDWQVVLNFTEKGIRKDFAPVADGNAWTSYHQYIFPVPGQIPVTARVDQRIIAAMDPSQPARYPEVVAKGEAPIPDTQAMSEDNRLTTDFQYTPEDNIYVEEGEWHYSHYRHARNLSDPAFAGAGSPTGLMPVFLAVDNELLRTEALMRLGRRLEAIGRLSEGTQVTRGGLPPIMRDASNADIERIIKYERSIELLSSAPMSLWFDRRRLAPRINSFSVDALGGLQTGPPAHLPVPST